MTVVAATLGIGLWGGLLLYGTWLELMQLFRLNVNGWYEFGKAYSGGSACYRDQYREAIELYGSTSLSVRAICAVAGVSYAGFRSYLVQDRRDLLLSRHGVAAFRLRMPRIRACGDVGARLRLRAPSTAMRLQPATIKYVEYNVSQIAHLFGLNPTGLSNQLRAHCPELLERRELGGGGLGF